MRCPTLLLLTACSAGSGPNEYTFDEDVCGLDEAFRSSGRRHRIPGLDGTTPRLLVTPLMDDDRALSEEFTLQLETDAIPVDLGDLFHISCGDGVRGSLVLDVGTVTSDVAELVVGPSGTTLSPLGVGSTVLDVPATFTVDDLPARGCGDLAVGDVLTEPLQLTVNVHDTPWVVGPACDGDLLLADADVRLSVTRPGTLGGARPEVLLRGDGVRIHAHERSLDRFRLEGEGTLTASIDGTTVRTFTVVPSTAVTGLDVDAQGQLPGGELALDTSFPATGLRVVAARVDGAPACGQPFLTDLSAEVLTPDVCASVPAECPGSSPGLLSDALDLRTPGSCAVDVTHTPSRSITSVVFLVVETVDGALP